MQTHCRNEFHAPQNTEHFTAAQSRQKDRFAGTARLHCKIDLTVERIMHRQKNGDQTAFTVQPVADPCHLRLPCFVLMLPVTQRNNEIAFFRYNAMLCTNTCDPRCIRFAQSERRIGGQTDPVAAHAKLFTLPHRIVLTQGNDIGQ